MRALVCSGVILVFVLSAQAQKQERKLIDRVLKPDLTLSHPMGKKSFANAPSFRGKQYSGKRGYLVKKFPSKSFRTRTPWYASRRHFARDSRYDTSSANTDSDRVIQNADRSVAQEQYATSERSAARKRASLDTRWQGTRPFRVRGTKQDSLDRQNAELGKLTIDQVREILNRNK